MIRSLFLSLALYCALVFTAGAALAAPVKDIDAPVTPGSPLTVRKLAEKIFKGLKEEENSSDLVLSEEKVLRQLGTKERSTAPAGAKLTSYESRTVRADGRRYLLLLVEVETPQEEGEPFGLTVLAVFPEGGDELLDVANMKTDRFCNLDQDKLFPLGPDDALLIRNHHSNSNQSYLTSTLLFVREGRLRRIAEVFTLSVVSDCAHSFSETLEWSATPDPEAPKGYPKVVAKAVLKHEPWPGAGLDCPKKSSKPATVFTETYRWSEAKKIFQASGNGMAGLDRFNKDKF